MRLAAGMRVASGRPSDGRARVEGITTTAHRNESSPWTSVNMREEGRPSKRARRPAQWNLDHPFSKDGGTSEKDEPDSDESEQEWEASERQQKKRRTQASIRIDVPVMPAVHLSDDEIEHNLAFCCKVCRCSQRKKNKIPSNDRYVTPALDVLWHRRCCHELYQVDEEWLSPFDIANQQAEQYHPELSGKAIPEKKIEVVKDVALRRRYDHAKTLEAEMYNDDELEHPVDMLRTNPQYVRNEAWFNSLTTRDEPKRAAVVVDAFGGIGGAVVALKRLGIAISKILHIEQDKVANHVYKHWHDARYNPDLPEATHGNIEHESVHGNIEHVYYRRFEKFEENIDEILVNHGPFDIIVGGPPCVDYSGVNANSKGTEGIQGSYLPRFGKLIKKINRRMVQRGHPTCFYLAENSALRDNLDLPIDKGDLSRIKEAFGIDWDFCMDSKDVSPLRRKRTYISNVPLSMEGLGDHLPNTCFDDGFDVAGRAIESDMMAKANCLMAHKGRLDDERMEIYKEGRLSGQRVFAPRTPTVIERERLMGFPEGYVSEPMEALFSNLVQVGFGCEFGAQAWEDKLDAKYHTFSGDYHRFGGKHFPFRFERKVFPVQLKLAPPMDTKTPDFYTAEQYSKRLLGNSFSIPTLEALLAPLQMIFATRHYPAFQHNFAWAPYGQGLRDAPSKAEVGTSPSDGHTTIEDVSLQEHDSISTRDSSRRSNRSRRNSQRDPVCTGHSGKQLAAGQKPSPHTLDDTATMASAHDGNRPRPSLDRNEASSSVPHEGSSCSSTGTQSTRGTQQQQHETGTYHPNSVGREAILPFDPEIDYEECEV